MGPNRPTAVGLIGTGAIAGLHARAYRNLGFTIRACTDVNEAAGRQFASATGAEFVRSYDKICAHPEIDFVDLCTLPQFRLPVVESCAKHRRHLQVQKPIATTLDVAERMMRIAGAVGIQLGVVSQHRFDPAVEFVRRALAAGQLGRLIQADAYVKWHRTAEYYSRPVKGTWSGEGGGALITQAIHQVDLLRWLAGPVKQVSATWQLGAVHDIEAEDVLSAVMRYANGATGVIQASTAMWPGYAERLELHGTDGTAIITGDRLTTWDVRHPADPPPLAREANSGASDPLAISVDSFERQFSDFAAAIDQRRHPLVSALDGYDALALVMAIYNACRTGAWVSVPPPAALSSS